MDEQVLRTELEAIGSTAKPPAGAFAAIQRQTARYRRRHRLAVSAVGVFSVVTVGWVGAAVLASSPDGGVSPNNPSPATTDTSTPPTPEPTEPRGTDTGIRCMWSDGSTAGWIYPDRSSDAPELTQRVKNESCDDEWIGSNAE